MRIRLLSFLLSALIFAASIPVAIPVMAETDLTLSAAELSGDIVKTDSTVYDINFMPERRQAIKYWALSNDSLRRSVTKYDLGRYAQYSREMGANCARIWLQVKEAISVDGSVSEERLLQLYERYLGYLQNAGITNWFWILNDMPEGTYYKDIRGWTKLKRDGGAELYADYTVEALKIMQKNNLILPIAIGVMNEPNDPSHNITNDDFAILVKAMKKKMTESGFGDIPLVGPEAAGVYRIDEIMGSMDLQCLRDDPEYNDALDIISYHAYGQLSGKSESLLEDLANAVESMGKEIWSTELCVMNGMSGISTKVSYAFGASIRMMRSLISDTAMLGTTAWMVHGDASETLIMYSDGRVRQIGLDGMMLSNATVGYGANGDNTFVGPPFYWMIREVFTKAPPGSVVHRLETNDSELVNRYAVLTDLVGFEREDGQLLEIIYNSTDKVKYYNLNNLAGKSAVIKQMGSESPFTFDTQYRNIVDGSIKNVCVPPETIMYVETTDEDVAGPCIDVVPEEEFVFNTDGKYNSRTANPRIVINVDENARVTVNGVNYPVEEDNKIVFTTDLAKDTEYEIKAVDKNCHETSKSVSFLYNPSLTQFMLDETEKNNATGECEIRGILNTKGTVVCGEQKVQTGENNRFVIPIKLEEGNNELKVMAYDEDGHSSEPKTVNVFCDTVKPTITLKQNNIQTDVPNAVVSGTLSETVRNLTIGGEPVQVNGDNSFSYIAVLHSGANSIAITAEDMLGNTATEYMSIVYTPTETSPHRVDGLMYARAAQQPVKLDGVFSESNWNLDIVMDKTVEGNPNNIVRWGAMWDATYLYVGAKVEDANICSSAPQPYNSDCIEIFLNPTAERAGGYTGADRQLWSAYVNNENVLYKNIFPFNSAWKITETGYNVEIAIPWSSLGISPRDGTKIGFDITCNDNDEGGETRQSVITWNGTSSNFATTVDFGLLVLTASDNVKYVDKQDTAGAEPTPDEPAKKTSYDIEIDGKTVEFKASVINDQIMIPTSAIEVMLGVKFKWAIGSCFTVELAGGHTLYAELLSHTVVYDGEELHVDNPTISDSQEVYVSQEIMEKYMGLTFSENGDKVILKKK